MPFRLQARYVLLTYAQCGSLDPWEVVALCSRLGGECIVGREEHSDGGIHLHAFVDFGRRYNTRNERFADVEGCHPNVLPYRKTPEKGWDYAIKDGDVVAGGLERPSDLSISAAGDAWSTILLAESVDEFWELARELAPRALLTNFNSLRSYAEWHYRPEHSPYSSPGNVSFDLSGVPELSDWVHLNLSGSGVVGTWIVLPVRKSSHGPSRFARPPEGGLVRDSFLRGRLFRTVLGVLACISS